MPYPMGSYWQERFWARVTPKPSGCWEWCGTINASGYGVFQFLRAGLTPIQHMSHRLSFTLYNGPIPDGLCVCHSCDNRRCVNPDHLWLGTQAENTQDSVTKGRRFAPGTAMVALQCAACGKGFTRRASKERYGSKNRDGNGPFCSRSCVGRGHSWARPFTRSLFRMACGVCGTEFERLEAVKPENPICSQSCAMRHALATRWNAASKLSR